MRWTAIIYGSVRADIAITGGVHTGNSVLKCMMVGAKVAMMTSAILQNGVGHFEAVKKDMLRWMEEREYESISIMQGSMSQQHIDNPAAFERANYLKVLGSYRAGV
ncbi:MAG: hypothetical protein HC888_07025 [Candidatus Competibacteraceae bacterium]|nr:hypothetical protein [Candidatus Competibacteraceae bacterium]